MSSVSSEAATCPRCGISEPGWRRPPVERLSPEEYERLSADAWGGGGSRDPAEPYPPHLEPLSDATERRFGFRKGTSHFRVGDTVRCNRLGDEGVGLIIDYSTDIARGGGTKLYPAWLVAFPNGRREWYNGISMVKVQL